MFKIQPFKRCPKCGEEKPATKGFWRKNRNDPQLCASRCRPCGDAIEAGKPRVSLTCIHCGKEFSCAAYVAKRRARRFCSNKCGALWRYSDDLVERFWSRVDKRGADECWEWAGLRVPDGYGNFSISASRLHELPFDCSSLDPERPRSGRSIFMGAHRVSFALANGRWPELHVMHTCDNPPCCNPRHLRLGTHTENMRDRQRKGRHAGAIFDSGKVRSIRKRAAAGERYVEIAESMNVDPEQVRRVLAGDRWRYVS